MQSYGTTQIPSTVGQSLMNLGFEASKFTSKYAAMSQEEITAKLALVQTSENKSGKKAEKISILEGLLQLKNEIDDL